MDLNYTICTAYTFSKFQKSQFYLLLSFFLLLTTCVYGISFSFVLNTINRKGNNHNRWKDNVKLSTQYSCEGQSGED